jgi:Protein of unknown function (DUF732)
MKRILLGGIAAGVVAGAMLGMGGAHADPGSGFAHYGYRGDRDAWSYRDELRYVGLNHEDARNANDLAWRLCNERAQGYSEYQVAAHLDVSPDGYTVQQEVAMVAGAEYHFCPMYLT